MGKNLLPSRRSFLRTAFGTAFAGGALALPSVGTPADKASLQASEATVVARLTLDHDLYDHGGVANGSIYFRLPPAGDTEIEWIDSFGRVASRSALPPPSSIDRPQIFSLRLDSGLTCCNWIRLKVNGVPQAEGAKFLLAPPSHSWDDFHVVSWAHYPDGFYDLLRQSGVDATIAYRDGDFSNVLDSNFNFYVEQMAWEVFAIYHKDQPLWKGLIAKVQQDRDNLKLWVRQPCLNDPKTDEYIHGHLRRYVRQHRAFHPLFYNIADELGQGDQIKPNDFCHSEHCTIKFAEYLRNLYGTPGQVESEWQAGKEMTRWDDASLRSGAEWQERDLMISYTTTDRAFDSIALASFHARYGGVANLNKQWGTSFPEPQGVGMSVHDEWEPVIGLARDTRSIVTLTEEALSDALGPLPKANDRWGRRAGWKAVQKPTNFQTWSQVLDFLKRFYKELGEVSSTTGWNVSPWCDFRNFMDATFADAVLRAAQVCKAEDPNARCATEGGQCPFPFGWYNYEQVLRAVDVIEPYNIGNNVEVIRSLKPETIMVSTHGYEYTPGKPLSAEDRIQQKRAVRPIWWGVFHAHRGSLIWDDNLTNYRFVDEKTRDLTPAAETFSELFKELHQGIPKLVVNSRRMHDGIALHYSQPSMQVHWLLSNLKYARQWVAHSGGDRGSHITAVRNGWTKLIEDLDCQYNFVSGSQIEAGRLSSGEYRAFIMPQSLAVSAREAEQIRQFVRDGGLLIADYRNATMNEHGRDLGHGQLDDVFGISRTPSSAPVGRPGTARGVASQGSLDLQGKQLNLLTPGDNGIKPSTGKAMAQSGSTPLVILNTFGKGKAVFLNLEIAAYAYQRLQASLASSLPELMESVLGLATITPRLRVLGADGKRLPGTEVVVYSNGGCEHVAIFRNPQFDDGGWGSFPTMEAREWAGSIDNSLVEKPARIRLVWSDEKQTYDVGQRKDLGSIKSLEASLDPWSPLVFTRSAQPLPDFRLDIPNEIKAGAMLNLTVHDAAPLPEGTARVVRIEIDDPSGKTYDLYSRNLLIHATPFRESIPMAFNDPSGRWKVRARDVATGKVVETPFTVAA
ncbi:MAG TPA: beta-galactosidase trimerization domain-containing protein [Terriglobia bacterium]|nr:beta-galactosidase trimerization domain-containing protein [Terriglobia bacterium]